MSKLTLLALKFEALNTLNDYTIFTSLTYATYVNHLGFYIVVSGYANEISTKS